jgi:hypothetical protein
MNEYSWVKVYQIYYDEFQKDSLLNGFVPYFNETSTVYLESGIICDLIKSGKCTNCKWFGVFSWKVASKVHGFNFNKLKEILMRRLRENEKYDLLTTSNDSIDGHLPWNPHFPRGLHVEMWPTFDLLMVKLLEKGIINKIPNFNKEMSFVYCNYFVTKTDLYLNYVNTLLKPAIDLFRDDKELRLMGTRAPKTLHETPPKRFTEHTGFKYYPHIPFVLERLINVYIELNDIKVGYVL